MAAGIKPVYLSKTVTTAGTRVQVSTTDLLVSSVYFYAPNANTNPVFIGDDTVSSTVYMRRLAANGDWEMKADDEKLPINLKYLYVDATTNGEKVFLTYLPWKPNV